VEHPYLFFVKLFEVIGLGHFAHLYPHVVYSWVVMILLIALGALAAKGVSLIPTKGQNVFELIVGGIEDFMVDITGEEGRWLLPIVATVFIYIFACNLIGLVPGFFPPTASLNTTLSCALVVVIFTHVIGIKYHGAKYIKHFLGPANSLPVLPSFWKHDGTRTGTGHSLHAGRTFLCAAAHYGTGHICRLGSGVRFLSSIHHVLYGFHGACPLKIE
jgi:F0F1-type ATP synthase membrane subunit a